MTREQATEVLKAYRNRLANAVSNQLDCDVQAFDMAIQALQAQADVAIPSAEPKTGHWIDSSNGWMCSECERDSRKDTNFCPDCGAKMVESQESEE